MLRGVRGAIDVAQNQPEDVVGSAEKLMNALIEANGLDREMVAAVFFTVTTDLNAAFPAAVRTRIRWNLVPFLCSQEIPVPNAPPRILRVLILFETDREQDEIRHQYLGNAASLRPDL